ncbi:hypothetical protein OHA61_17130 [Streptomyces sp. NBC_00885]|uniref:hypothetical protein n=1 Tax=Streptomyces sp. NBC_00885 TaxID=2975857 RepID=UPI0038673D30|nr:hypothetical protein OHA61_17130 [Streptomyces sp. NBC_00885]
MAENVKLESVGIHQVRSEYVDWGMKSAHPAIRQLVGHLSHILAESRELVPGPASELVVDVEEITASHYSNETNRVLRVTADCEGGPVAFDVVVQLAAPTAFTSPCK